MFGRGQQSLRANRPVWKNHISTIPVGADSVQITDEKAPV